MSYGIGTVLALVGGAILALAVAQGARVGARAGTRMAASGVASR